MKVLIVGGGIGGLTAALCCAHFGHDVVVLEQSRTFGEVGAGIQLPPNAMAVFKALGVADRIAQDAVRPAALQARMGLTGRDIFSVPLIDWAEARWGSPYLHIHRADYVAALVDCLVEKTSVTLRFGATVAGIDAKAASVTLADGERMSGDVLVGADGIHSVVRESLFGPDAPRFTGTIAWRAVVPMEVLGDAAPARTACVWMGPGRHAVTYQLRRGAMANFVGVVERDTPGSEDWTARGTKAEALTDFAGWHPTVTGLIETASDDTLYRWALYDRPPLPTWGRGCTTLLGDAAHPMLPFMAQGAAMAVEDGWVLARTISDEAGPVEQALTAYAAQRLPRTSRAHAASRANRSTFHKRSLPARLATYGPMWLAGRVAPQIVRQRLDWLYRHDVTQA